MSRTMSRMTAEQIVDVNARADLAGLATSLGARLRKSGRGMVGSCPICGGSAKATRFEIKGGDRWVCAVCEDAGDAIRLVQKCRGVDFRAAVEWLGGSRALSSEDEAKLKREREAREAKERRAADAYHQREQAACERIWASGRAPTPDRLGRYLAARGLTLPASAVVRECDGACFYHGEEKDERGFARPRLLAKTPAMLARFFGGDGRPCGLHITHLAADWTAKAALFDPETGVGLPSKKMRGTKKGAHLVLREVAPGAPCRLFLAEGIETGLSVAVALQRAGALRPTDRFWAAGDLGNLGGKALGTIAHPTLTGPAGRAQRAPSDTPDMDAPGIVIPACVTELVLLGDGDSDPFTTRLAMARGKARYARAGLTVAVAMAEPGRDFNDMLQEDAA